MVRPTTHLGYVTQPTAPRLHTCTGWHHTDYLCNCNTMISVCASKHRKGTVKNGVKIQMVLLCRALTMHEWSWQVWKWLWVSQGVSGEGVGREGVWRTSLCTAEDFVNISHLGCITFIKYFYFFSNKLTLAYCNLFTLIFKLEGSF
jgi:hypothetical protein